MSDETRLHWNEEIPGPWYEGGHVWGARGVQAVGSNIRKYAKARPGVYRLFAMADVERRIPLVLSRIAGSDSTGTLYIGRGSSLLERLQQLTRSLREPGRKIFLGEHQVGERIRRNPLLREMFPGACLVVAWVYTKYPEQLERNLLGHYEKCFGEIPPLNTERGGEWFEPPDGW